MRRMRGSLQPRISLLLMPECPPSVARPYEQTQQEHGGG